jgi:hypothetical protein
MVYALIWRHGELPRTDADADHDPAVSARLSIRDACPPNGTAVEAELLSITKGDPAQMTPWKLDVVASSQARARALTVVGGEVSLALESESVHLVRIECGNPIVAR